MIRYLSLDPEVPAAPGVYWDTTLLGDLLTETEKDIIIIPGARQAHLVDDISMELEQYPNPTVIITSDEENNFPTSELYHPNMRLFVTYPNKEKHQKVDGYLPIGYRPETRAYIKENRMGAKSLDWFFAGQITHGSRQQCLDKLVGLPNGRSLGTNGFARGIDYNEYMEHMCRAKVVPCPAGHTSPDSFRLYEALEAGCIPIPENKTFWTMLFGEVPFPVVDDYSDLSELINHYKDRPDVNNKCQSWWLAKKKEIKWILQS